MHDSNSQRGRRLELGDSDDHGCRLRDRILQYSHGDICDADQHRLRARLISRQRARPIRVEANMPSPVPFIPL